MAATLDNAKIVLYTNHACPWAHRVNIALAELGVPYTEEIIDLETPRTPEYLKINPRGLVPSLSYNGDIITESAIVSQFLVDAYPSHLVPQPTSADAALRRARIAFFVDTFISKFTSLFLNKTFYTASGAEKEEIAAKALKGLVTEVEPLLGDAAPYFGGSDKLTLAEVLTGSFALRVVTFAKHGLLPQRLTDGIPEQAPNFWKWARKVAAHPSVTTIWDEEAVISKTKSRIAKLQTQS